MYSVYILKSDTTGRYYVGMTDDINRRVHEHNSGSTRTTRNRGPWKVVHLEKGFSRQEAWLRERQIKKYKGGEAFKKLINQHGGVA